MRTTQPCSLCRVFSAPIATAIAIGLITEIDLVTVFASQVYWAFAATYYASETISEGLEIQNFPGGACPHTPLGGTLAHANPVCNQYVTYLSTTCYGPGLLLQLCGKQSEMWSLLLIYKFSRSCTRYTARKPRRADWSWGGGMCGGMIMTLDLGSDDEEGKTWMRTKPYALLYFVCIAVQELTTLLFPRVKCTKGHLWHIL